MSNMKSPRKLAIILIVAAVATFSIAYAATTNNLSITGTDQSITNPDVYFVNGYDDLSASNSDGGAGVTLSGGSLPGATADKTGKAATITARNFNCTTEDATVTWTIPIKNYGTSIAHRANNGITLNVSPEGQTAVTYTATFDDEYNKAVLSSATDLSGLTFEVTCPENLAADTSDTVTIKATVAQAGLFFDTSTVVSSFDFSFNIPFTDTAPQPASD